MKAKYDVVVGNIGYVVTDGSKREALAAYNEYIWQSKLSLGRASGEDVTILKNGEIFKQYMGSGLNQEI